MHIGYEAVDPWPVERDRDAVASAPRARHPKPVLKSHPDQGIVVVDRRRHTDHRHSAWRRGTIASAIARRSTGCSTSTRKRRPRDPTIAAKFNTYRFADYKESMIALLAKVVRVSVDTVAITEAMRAIPRDPAATPASGD